MTDCSVDCAMIRRRGDIRSSSINLGLVYIEDVIGSIDNVDVERWWISAAKCAPVGCVDGRMSYVLRHYVMAKNGWKLINTEHGIASYISGEWDPVVLASCWISSTARVFKEYLGDFYLQSNGVKLLIDREFSPLCPGVKRWNPSLSSCQCPFGYQTVSYPPCCVPNGNPQNFPPNRPPATSSSPVDAVMTYEVWIRSGNNPWSYLTDVDKEDIASLWITARSEGTAVWLINHPGYILNGVDEFTVIGAYWGIFYEGDTNVDPVLLPTRLYRYNENGEKELIGGPATANAEVRIFRNGTRVGTITVPTWPPKGFPGDPGPECEGILYKGVVEFRYERRINNLTVQIEYRVAESIPYCDTPPPNWLELLKPVVPDAISLGVFGYRVEEVGPCSLC